MFGFPQAIFPSMSRAGNSHDNVMLSVLELRPNGSIARLALKLN
jgi:hypothetical protein